MINSSRRIFFICPDTNTPSGGVKQLYRQVDILNKNGFRAFILHGKYGFKCKWFDNATSVAYNSALFKELERRNPIKARKNLINVYKKAFKDVIKLRKTLMEINDKKKDTVIGNDDILVFPETYGPAIAQVLTGIEKVIYNQNCYYTFVGYGLKDQITPYTNSKVIAIIVASIDATNYIKYAFPGSNLFRVHYGIDKKVFNYSANKKKQIAFMPRKLREDIIQVINILKARNILGDWTLIEIANMKENEVSNILKESAVFLSFNNREGFGMPPAEAMACGCIVIGYPGKGGEEYFNREFSYPIADRDVQNFSKTLEQVLIAYEKDRQPFLQQGKIASDFILSEYALEVEEQDILNVWNSILQND